MINCSAGDRFAGDDDCFIVNKKAGCYLANKMNRESGPSSAMGANSPCWTDAEMQILLSGLRQFERWSPLRNVLFTKLETHLQVHGVSSVKHLNT